MSGNEISRVFETLMTVPGMNDLVRIEMKLSRKENDCYPTADSKTKGKMQGCMKQKHQEAP